MSVLKGTIIHGEDNYDIIDYDVNYIKEINLKCKRFAPDDKYYLSVDASTTCTGICFLNEKRNMHVVLDFQRKDTPKELYIRQLELLISGLVRGFKVELVLVERPIHQIDNRGTRVLESLWAEIKRMLKRIIELKDVRTEFVRPQRWKSAMYIKVKGENRYNDKECNAEDVTTRYPIYSHHLWKCKQPSYGVKDFDSFDAIGIMYFYLEFMRDSKGNKINFCEPNFTLDSLVIVSYAENVEQFVRIIMTKGVATHDIEEVLWNKSENYYRNIKMASSFKKVIIMNLSSNPGVTILTCFEAGIDLRTDVPLFIAVLPKSFISTADRNNLKSSGCSIFEVY